MNNTDIVKRSQKAVARGVSFMADFYVQKAKNAELWDVEGNHYLDLSAGIAVANTGHSHPKVVAAIQNQAEQFIHTCSQIIPYENFIQLAERINAIAPHSGDVKSAFFSTGAEAMENTVKIARAKTGRDGIIAFDGGFHGRTFMAMSMTGRVLPYQNDFGAMANSVFHVPYPVQKYGVSVQDSLDAIERLFRATIPPHDVAGIVLEPIQGEGGVCPAPDDFMVAIRKLCDKHGIVMIADEIQTGFGRTGKMFAMEHYSVEADMTAIAKGLASGMPLSGVVGQADVMDAPNVGGIGGTYAGNPLCIAAALASLDVMEEEALCQRSHQLGERVQQKFKSLIDDVPCVFDVRGQGLIIGIEIRNASGEPDAETAQKIRLSALDKNVIVLVSGIYKNVIRLVPPLTIEENILEQATDILMNCIKQA